MARRRPRTTASQRRTGPDGEDHWWDDGDQAFVEQPLVQSREWGRGWRTVPMWNNAERMDPYGDDPDSDAVRQERQARRLTALDEGAAWRLRREAVLAVARVEVFAEVGTAHRAAWQEHGARCLDAVWRQRWHERDRVPGWIEATWKPQDRIDAVTADDAWREALGQVDWLTVEDQTGTSETGVVTRYEHLSIWCGRALATLTVRHDDALDLDPPAVAAAMAAYRRLWTLDA